jgi:hypothetical protein
MNNEKYQIKSPPCWDKYANKHMPWYVLGGILEDGKIVGGGILHWCYDEEDAKFHMNEMKKFPNQFADLKICKYEEE